jgi:membrane protein required for colicin V production
VTWVIAFWLAYAFAGPFTVWLTPHISVASVRTATAYAVLFLGGLLIGGILTSVVVHGLRNSAFSSADRTLGAGFGVVRGVVLVALFVLLAGMTPARQDPWWSQSVLLNKFEWLADGLRMLIPEPWLDQLRPAESAADEASSSF